MLTPVAFGRPAPSRACSSGWASIEEADPPIGFLRGCGFRFQGISIDCLRLRVYALGFRVCDLGLGVWIWGIKLLPVTHHVHDSQTPRSLKVNRVLQPDTLTASDRFKTLHLHRSQDLEHMAKLPYRLGPTQHTCIPAIRFFPCRTAQSLQKCNTILHMPAPENSLDWWRHLRHTNHVDDGLEGTQDGTLGAT